MFRWISSQHEPYLRKTDQPDQFEGFVVDILDELSERAGFEYQWVYTFLYPLQWRHNGRDVVSNHQPHDCLVNRSFLRRSKKISKLRVTDLCSGNSPVTGKFPVQRANNAWNASIWWRHHIYHQVTALQICIDRPYPSQWHRMASQITSNSTVCSSLITKETSKLDVSCLRICEGIPPVTG